MFRLALLISVLLFNSALADEDESAPDGSRIPIPSAQEVSRIAAFLPDKPTGVGRPIEDRAAWQAAGSQPFFKQQLSLAEAFAKEPIPEITNEMFNDLLKSGLRVPYQKPFQKRSARLEAFVVSECIRNDGTYLPLIEAELHAILEDDKWASPTYILVAKAWGGNDAVDLQVAALAGSLATADYWLGDRLKPQTRHNIHTSLRRRVLDGYEKAIKTGQPLWTWMNRANNWNAVCSSGVVVTALTICETKEERALVVQGALNSMVNYYESFYDDGFLPEGIGYWHFGFGSYLSLAETLYQQTGGQINLYQGIKVRNAALFLQHIQIVPGVYPAFGDAFPKAKKEPSAVYALINTRWGMGWDATKFDIHQSDMEVESQLFDRLYNFGIYGFPWPEIGGTMAAGSPPANKDSGSGSESKRWFFKDGNVLVCRSIAPGHQPFGVAIKGGKNGGHHGHIDNGSYVVAAGRSPLIVDPGMEEYTINSSGPRRFESEMMNSFGHDVPYVGKTLQKGGPDSLGKIIETEFTDAQDTLKMDLTSGYPVPGMVKLVRTYVFHRDKPTLEVIDDAEFSKPTAYGSALITLGSWKDDGPGQFVITEGNASIHATVSARGDGGEIINKEEPVTGFRLMAGIKPARLGYNMSAPVTHLVLTTKIVPKHVEAKDAG